MKDKEMRDKFDNFISELQYAGFLNKDKSWPAVTQDVKRLWKPTRKYTGGLGSLGHAVEKGFLYDRVEKLESDFNELLKALKMERYTEPKKSGIRKIRGKK